MFEGKAKLMFGKSRLPSIFYNPRMSMNRDVAILVAECLSGKIRICDPMTASGVRAIRYLLECSNVDVVEASDVSVKSVEFARRMIQLNQIDQSKVIVVVADANSFLINRENQFNLVDLDPFGCPVRFYENALRSVVDHGVLAVTATDMALLTGARHSACFRKYNIVPVRADFAKEGAVRILAASIALAAIRLERGTRVIFSHASDHYSRVYVQVRVGKKAANASSAQLGFIEYCPVCLKRDSRKRFEEFHSRCDNCGGRVMIGGPIWLGALWDVDLVRGMSGYSGSVTSSRIADVQRLLDQVEGEMIAPAFYYRVDYAAKSLGRNPPRVVDILGALRDCGYVATRTHFHPNGVRTNAPINRIRYEVSRLANKIQTKKVYFGAL